MACLFFCLAQSSQIKMKQEQNWRIEAQRRAAKSQVCYGTSQPLVESMITISDMKSSFWRVNTTVWLLMQWKCRAADEIYRFNGIGKTLIVLSHAMRNSLMFDSFNPTQPNNVNIQIHAPIISTESSSFWYISHEHVIYTRTFLWFELP